MSRSVLKQQVRFAGLIWKEEDERSRQGQSRRKLRKIHKKEQAKMVHRTSDEQAEYDEKQTRNAFHILKDANLATYIVKACALDSNTLEFLICFLYLLLKINVDAENVAEGLKAFRDSTCTYDKIKVPGKANLLLFWRTKVIRTNFFFDPSVDPSSTDTDEGEKATEAFWATQKPGLRKDFNGLPKALKDHAAAFYPRLQRAVDESPAVAASSSHDESKDTTLDPKSSSGEKGDPKSSSGEKSEAGTAVTSTHAAAPAQAQGGGESPGAGAEGSGKRKGSSSSNNKPPKKKAAAVPSTIQRSPRRIKSQA